MERIRKYLIFRLICLSMSIQILNLSVDAPDFTVSNLPEDLAYNDMESVVEIVLEGLLGFENAIAEREENDENDGSSLDFKKFVFAKEDANSNGLLKVCLKDRFFDTYSNSHFLSVQSEVPYPPPEV